MSREARVGIFVLLGLIVLTFFTFRVSKWGLIAEKGYRLTVDFDTAAGLEPKSDVKMAGVPIGKVEEIQLVGNRAHAEGGDRGFAVRQAAGAFGELADVIANLHCDMTPTEIKQLALQFARGPGALGRLDVRGPFDATKLEGRLQVAVLAIDRQLLNLVGAARGMDFGSSVLNSTNQIDLATGGRMVGIVGQLSGTSLSVARQGLVAPAFDLVADYSLTVTRAQQTALIKTLILDARRKQHRLLSGALTKPIPLNWAQAGILTSCSCASAYAAMRASNASL